MTTFVIGIVLLILVSIFMFGIFMKQDNIARNHPQSWLSAPNSESGRLQEAAQLRMFFCGFVVIITILLGIIGLILWHFSPTSIGIIGVISIILGILFCVIAFFLWFFTEKSIC